MDPSMLGSLLGAAVMWSLVVILFVEDRRQKRAWKMPEDLTVDQQRWVIYHLQLAGVEYVSPTIARLERAEKITANDIANMDLTTYSLHRDKLLHLLNQQAYQRRLAHQERCERCDETLLHTNHELFG